jgi:hypothetical protein
VKIESLTDLVSVRDYLNRIGAEARSLKTAVVKQQHGKYWKDLAVIHFKKDGTVTVSGSEYEPNPLEANAMAIEFAQVEWPELQPLHRLTNLPKMIADAPKESVFEFRDRTNRIVMVQVRVELEGDKKYVPWTYWSDDRWRPCEPDGSLPLFNANKLNDVSTVFVHEGAKAARHVQWMVDGETAEARKALAEHPWGQELMGAAHVGWIGGAMSPYRTDWSILTDQSIKRVYIVADNDDAGKSAVPDIAKQLRIPTFMIQFTDEFKSGFDLADKFPEDMFGDVDGGRFYVGPAFRDLLHPATWATDILPPPSGQGRPGAVLRDSFKGMWAYIEEADVFVCTEMPEIVRQEPILNKMLAAFSHVTDTCRLIVKSYQGRSTRLCYRPDHDGLLVTYRGSSAINLHVKSPIRAKQGDPKPFLDFMRYLFVNDSERKEAERWCATLIARPEVRMGYGMLLISERQGVGKTTLGAHVLAPLVGPQNVGYPSEGNITSDFNEWVAHKRLAIVNEIYSGSSWKAYHALKSVITERDITVNQKYVRQYVIDNWCHVLACSNSMRALKMENDDRRWFYPEVTEVPWPMKRFNEFRRWIERGGLSIVKHWAETYGDYITPSERAPMTERKREMIEGSRSEAQVEAVAVAEALRDHHGAAAITIKDVVGWVRARAQGRVFDSDYELRKAMADAGLTPWQKRIKVHGRLQYVMLNDKLLDIVQRSEDQAAAIRDHTIKCTDFMQGEM